MGRKRKEEISEDARAMDIVAAEKREEQITAEKAMELYGDGLPYERLRYMEEVKSLLELTRKSIVEAGKRLIILKANEEKYGGWMQTLEQIGVHYRFASRAMGVARRFGTLDNLSKVGFSKLEALEDLTNTEAEALDDGKDVLGLNLDDIDRMTAKQLREELRKGRKQVDKMKDKYKKEVEEMNNEISDLRLRASNLDPPTKEQLAEAELRKYQNPIIDNMLEATERLNRATAAIDEAQKIPDIPFEALDKLLEPWKGIFDAFVAQTDDFIDAFNNIHVDKGRG